MANALARKRNEKLLDDISLARRQLKEATFGPADGNLETLKDHYYELIKKECPNWIQEIEEVTDQESNSKGQ